MISQIFSALSCWLRRTSNPCVENSLLRLLKKLTPPTLFLQSQNAKSKNSSTLA